MYNWKTKKWIAECNDKKQMDIYCSNLADSAQAQFYYADMLLSERNSGGNTADAVWYMEKAAKNNYPMAAYAMGQMFHSGWSVSKNKKTAKKWYKKAAELGLEEAEIVLSAMKKKSKQKTIILTATIVVAILLSIILGLGLYEINKNKSGIKVGDNTELVECVTVEEFNDELSKLIEEYDDEAVVSGQRSTNRLILNFEGDSFDLSGFLADKVIARENNRLIIQFSTEEEAQRCLDELKNTEGIVYVCEDDYSTIANPANNANTSSYTTYTSPYTGYDYYSWGIQDLQLDILAEYLKNNYAESSAKVAILDTGFNINEETDGRFVDGYDYSSENNPYNDPDGHGTHVSGIVLNATQGLDVKVIPIRLSMAPETEAYTTSEIMAGIQYAAEKDADVINMSLGGAQPDPQAYAIAYNMYKTEIDYAMEKGAVVVVSSGNETDNTAIYLPASVDECITVAAHDINRNIADFSNFGAAVDVSAPGVDILSYYDIDGKFVESLQGTSMAAPHIAALAAMVKMCVPNASPVQIQKYIKDYCVDQGNTDSFGAGICESSLFAGN